MNLMLPVIIVSATMSANVSLVVMLVLICIDLEGTAGNVRSEHDFTFVFMDGFDVARPDLKVMQGNHGIVVPGQWDEQQFFF